MAKKKNKKPPNKSREARNQEQAAVKKFFSATNQTELLEIHARLEHRYQTLLSAYGLILAPEARERLNRIDAVEYLTQVQRNSPQTTADTATLRKILGYGDAYDPDATPAQRSNRLQRFLMYLTPCFKTGVIKTVNLTEIEYELLDVRENGVTLTLRVYAPLINNTPINPRITSIMAPVLSATCDINIEDDGTDLQLIPVSSDERTHDMRDLYLAIPTKKLTTDPIERAVWSNSVLKYVRSYCEKMPTETVLNEALNTYTFVMTRLNMFLNQKPASRPVQDGTTSGTKSKPDVTLQPETGDKRRVRTVGPMRVVSVRPPRPVTEKTMLTYRTPAWQVRGHVRKYKSGKTVYVQPHVNQRRCLADRAPGAAPAPVDIKMRVPRDPVQAAADARTQKGG